jgi:hypothetical protein
LWQLGFFKLSILPGNITQIILFIMGGGNRIVVCNRCHKPFYVFSIFKIPANVPAVNGVLTLNAITDDSSANATGTAI